MVTRYGMSSIGPIALEDNNNEQMFLGGEFNEAIADRIDVEVCKIVNHCEQIATKIILDNRVVIDLIVEKLLDAETINGEEFRKLVKEYTILPVKNNKTFKSFVKKCSNFKNDCYTFFLRVLFYN
jgi:cell division protease FtsH